MSPYSWNLKDRHPSHTKIKREGIPKQTCLNHAGGQNSSAGRTNAMSTICRTTAQIGPSNQPLITSKKNSLSACKIIIFLFAFKCRDSANYMYRLLTFIVFIEVITVVQFVCLFTGLEINEKIQSHFAIRYENLVAISQILVAKSPRCFVLSAV